MQYRRTNAQFRHLPEGFVDGRVERNDTAGEITPNRERLSIWRSGRQQGVGKSSGDFSG
jgi:hypothetical protein